MGAMYGKNPLTAPEIKGQETLSNGMKMVWAGPMNDGTYAADIYSPDKKTLVSMQHGIHAGGCGDDKAMGELIKMLMESMIDEF